MDDYNIFIDDTQKHLFGQLSIKYTSLLLKEEALELYFPSEKCTCNVYLTFETHNAVSDGAIVVLRNNCCPLSNHLQ